MLKTQGAYLVGFAAVSSASASEAATENVENRVVSKNGKEAVVADSYRTVETAAIRRVSTGYDADFLRRSRSRGSSHGHSKDGEDGVKLHFEC